MTISHDRARETGIDMAEDLQRDVVTRQVCRGVGRLVRTLGFSSLNELPLPNGRRADIVALSASGDIWIIEV
ncbi:MAG: MmcB family DNA repair protein, partial [Hyphomicrobium sp.]